MSDSIGVGLIGFGTVGSGVVELLQDAPSSMRRRKHIDFSLQRIAVRDLKKSRRTSIDPALLTTNAEEVVASFSAQ